MYVPVDEPELRLRGVVDVFVGLDFGVAHAELVLVRRHHDAELRVKAWLHVRSGRRVLLLVRLDENTRPWRTAGSIARRFRGRTAVSLLGALEDAGRRRAFVDLATAITEAEMEDVLVVASFADSNILYSPGGRSKPGPRNISFWSSCGLFWPEPLNRPTW